MKNKVGKKTNKVFLAGNFAFQSEHRQMFVAGLNPEKVKSLNSLTKDKQINLIHTIGGTSLNFV